MKLHEERQRRAKEDEEQAQAEGKKGANDTKDAKGRIKSAKVKGIELTSAVELDGKIHPSRRNRVLRT